VDTTAFATLTADAAWSGHFQTVAGKDALEADSSVELNGHGLAIAPEYLLTPNRFVIKNSAEGDPATVTFATPEGQVYANAAVAFQGNLRIGKDGAGTYRPTAQSSYAGGTEVRAGIAENATAANATAYGVATSVIKVCDGASFDWKGAYGTSYSFDLAGSGFGNKGALFTSVAYPEGTGWWERNCIGDITLSADATIDSSNGIIPVMYASSNPNPHEITLNGHALTFASSGTKYNQRPSLRGIKAMDAGTIVLGGTGASFYALESDLSNATLEIVSGTQFSIEAKVTVETLVDRRESANNTQVHDPIYVASCLKACATAPFENVCLGTETAKNVTLDLTQLTAPFNVTLESPTRALTFAEGTVVTVDFGSRVVKSGDKLIAWSVAPNATFKLPNGVEGKLEVRDDGLYFHKLGFLVIIK